MNADLPLYQQVADRIAQLIHDRVYEPGERLPSIRDVHADFSVSINTAREAFRVLEDRGVVEARSQSGHYVRTGPLVCDDDGMEFPVITGSAPLSRTADRLTRRVLTDSMRRGWINLATGGRREWDNFGANPAGARADVPRARWGVAGTSACLGM